MLPTDIDLLGRIKRRDREALEALYDRHASRLYTVARHITSDGAAATAVLEEMFLALWEGVETYDSHYGTPACWLVRVVRDRCLARQAQIRSTTVDETAGPPTPRRLVEQAFYGGMGVEALAGLYQLPETEVRQLLRTGIAELRVQFAVGDTR